MKSVADVKLLDVPATRSIRARERHEHRVIAVEVGSTRDFERRDEDSNPARRSQDSPRIAQDACELVVVEVLEDVTRVDRVHGPAGEWRSMSHVEPHVRPAREVDVDVDEVRIRRRAAAEIEPHALVAAFPKPGWDG